MKTMKTMIRLTALCAALGFVVSASAADMLKYKSRPGGKMRIEGTSTIHDWWAESAVIGGTVELDSSFPTDPAKTEVKAGPLAAQAAVAIVVRTFKCQWGGPMDAVMQESMDAVKYPKIEFKLKELTFKEVKDGALVFDSKGDVTVRGKTKELAFPVRIERPDAKSIKIKGEVGTKMSEFEVPSPAPKVGLGLIKTADEVKLIFEWNLAQVPAAAAP